MKKILLPFAFLSFLCSGAAYSQCAGFDAFFSYDSTSCNGDTITLTSIYTGNPLPPLQYQWSYGIGGTVFSNAENVDLTLMEGQSIYLVITDSNGCVGSEPGNLIASPNCASDPCDQVSVSTNHQPDGNGGTDLNYTLNLVDPNYYYASAYVYDIGNGTQYNTYSFAGNNLSFNLPGDNQYYDVTIEVAYLLDSVNFDTCLFTHTEFIDSIPTTNNGCAFDVQITYDTNLCNGDLLNLNAITFNGGTAPFSYWWSYEPNVNYNDMSAISVGFIDGEGASVSVTDANGCYAGDTIITHQASNCDSTSNGDPCDAVQIITNHSLDTNAGEPEILLSYEVILGSSQELYYGAYGVSAVINGNTTQFAQGNFTGDTTFTIPLSQGNTYNAYVEVAYLLDSVNFDTCLVWLTETIHENTLNSASNQLAEAQVSLFPNPTKGEAFIDVESRLLGSRVEVLNAVGQTVNSFVINKSRVVINTNGLAEGFYSVVISTIDNQRVVKKLMVVK